MVIQCSNLLSFAGFGWSLWKLMVSKLHLSSPCSASITNLIGLYVVGSGATDHLDSFCSRSRIQRSLVHRVKRARLMDQSAYPYRASTQALVRLQSLHHLDIRNSDHNKLAYHRYNQRTCLVPSVMCSVVYGHLNLGIENTYQISAIE